jgi:hypothetical protein
MQLTETPQTERKPGRAPCAGPRDRLWSRGIFVFV